MPRFRRLSLLVACIWAAAPSKALAADRDDDGGTAEAATTTTLEPMPALRGLQLGARIGYALPNGALSSDSSLSTPISKLETASVPIGIEAGYRLSRALYLGGTLAWGPGIAPNAQGTCPPNASCFRQDAQLRAEARFYFSPERRVSWWASAGGGWEVAAFSQSAGASGATATLTGPVLADLELGFDSRRGARGIGMYFGMSLAEFLTHGQNPTPAPVATWIDNPSIHVWFTLGVRGSYGPW